MYLGARKWISSKLVFCLQNCKAFGGSRVETRRCISRLEHLFWANLCCLLDCKAFGGSRVRTRKCISRQEDVFWGKKMYFEQTCVVYLIIRPSAGRGLRLEARRSILSNCCLLNCGPRVKTRRCIWKQDVFWANLCFLLDCKAFGGSRFQTRRCTTSQENVFWANLCFYWIVRVEGEDSKMYLEAEDVFWANLCCSLNCKAFGGSRASTRRCISVEGNEFWANLCCLVNCKAFGGSRMKTRRRISRQEDVFWANLWITEL